MNNYLWLVIRFRLPTIFIRFGPKHFHLTESQDLILSRNYNIDKLTLHPITGKGLGLASWDRVDYSASDQEEKTDGANTHKHYNCCYNT